MERSSSNSQNRDEEDKQPTYSKFGVEDTNVQSEVEEENPNLKRKKPDTEDIKKEGSKSPDAWFGAFEQIDSKFMNKDADSKERKNLKKKQEQKQEVEEKRIPANVLLGNMFSDEDFRGTVDDFFNRKRDVFTFAVEECERFGPLERIAMPFHRPGCVLIVRFKDKNDAQKCIDSMNGRWYNDRQISVTKDDELERMYRRGLKRREDWGREHGVTTYDGEEGRVDLDWCDEVWN